MYIITVISNQTLEHCHMLEGAMTAYRYFRHYVLELSEIRPENQKIKEAFIKKEYKTNTHTINITIFSGPEIKEEKLILYNNQYITPSIYIKKALNKNPVDISRYASKKNMSVYQYIEASGWLPSQIADRAKRTTANLSEKIDQGREYARASRPQTKLQSLEDASKHSLDPLSFSEFYFSTDT